MTLRGAIVGGTQKDSGQDEEKRSERLCEEHACHSFELNRNKEHGESTYNKRKPEDS